MTLHTVVMDDDEFAAWSKVVERSDGWLDGTRARWPMVRLYDDQGQVVGMKPGIFGAPLLFEFSQGVRIARATREIEVQGHVHELDLDVHGALPTKIDGGGSFTLTIY